MEGGDFGGECSGRINQPFVASCGGKRSNAGTETATVTRGWNDTEFVLKALSCAAPGDFLQQSCEVGISIWPQSFFIMRQQARSSTVISASGAIHAIAGATKDTRSRRIAPSLCITFTITSIRQRFPANGKRVIESDWHLWEFRPRTCFSASKTGRCILVL